MSNLLAIPLKTTYKVENLQEGVRNYIYNHSGAHPDEFKDDIILWQRLRRDATSGRIHVDQIKLSLIYHAQLLSVITKLPSDIQVEFAYAPVFSPSALPVELPSIAFERAAVLFNLGALYSQLASAVDRSTKDGLKSAMAYYQNAAGVFSYLISSAIPGLVFPNDIDDTPHDLSENFLKVLEWLMLAQAQECGWQIAKLAEQYRNSIISRISARAAWLYRSAVTTARQSPSTVRNIFPSDWLPHMETKEHHFEAVAQYRKSLDEVEGGRYGIELARLACARTEVKVAYDIARRGKIATPVLQDVQSLLDTVQNDFIRAERDNDLIYHHDVPAASTLPTITHAELVKSIPPSDLVNPVKLVDKALFGKLLGWAARVAITIYNDKKEKLIWHNFIDVTNKMQEETDNTLRALNLPASLEALEKPIGLPPSLLSKAEEVRVENGAARIEASLEDVERLAARDLAILDEAMDILDNEASADEAARKSTPLKRLPSHEANAKLVEKEKRYRAILSQAADSDEIVRKKWDAWEANITELTWSEEELEASVPSSTMPGRTFSDQGTETQLHANALRAIMDQLEQLKEDWTEIVNRVQAKAKTDDITPRILDKASGLERFADVQPSLYEDVIEDELAKYDEYPKGIAVIRQKQGTQLAAVKERHALFLQSRKEDPSVKEREHALQSLDLAYHKYKEITQNLDEGFKFYNDLAGILIQFKESCKAWSHERNQEIHRDSALSRSMGSMSLRSEHEDSRGPKPPKTQVVNSPRSPPSGSRRPAGRSSLGLPSINSSDWGFEEVMLPPGPPITQKRG